MDEDFSWTQKLIIIFLLIGPVIFPLFKPGYYPSHDGTAHLFRTVELSKMVESGEFPVRWAANFNFGFGAPTFNFYMPLFYYLASFAHWAGLGYFGAIKSVIILGFGLSAAGMFLLCREIWSGTRLRPAERGYGEVNNWAGPPRLARESGEAGIIGAFAYIYIPYRFVDAYVRGAYSEFLVLSLFPWVFFGFLKLAATGKLWFFYLASFSLAAGVLAHNFLSLFLLIFLVGYLLVMIARGNLPKRHFRKVGLSILLGLGLSAFFWLPAFFERGYLKTDLSTLVDYRDHFVTLGQLWNSPWGYGSSLPGTASDGMSFQIGKIQLILALLVCFLVFPRLSKIQRVQVTFFTLATIVFIFLVLPYSDFVWQKMFSQLPWRFLGFASFSLAVLVSGIFHLLRREKLLLFIVIGVLLIFNIRMARPSSYLTQESDRIFESMRATTSWREQEFVPRWINSSPTKVASARLEGEGEIKEMKNLPTKYRFWVNSVQKQKWHLNIFYFPGWQAWVDGQKAKIEIGSNGTMDFEVPVGQHEIKAEFGRTKLRLAADLVSLGSFLFLVGGVAWSMKRSMTHELGIKLKSIIYRICSR